MSADPEGRAADPAGVRLPLRAIPLDAAWRARLDELAGSRGLPPVGTGLGAALREVSDAYNAANFRLPWTRDRLAARLHFFLPRDQAKVAAALRDVPIGPWSGEGPALRVVDVGAGLGASTLGAVRALRGRGVTRPIEAWLQDRDRDALAVAGEVLAGVPGVRVRIGEAAPASPDLVLFANVLVELPEAEAASRLDAAVAGRAPGGLVVVVEPALHGPTRRLMGLRDRVAASGAPILAPCPHSGRCAMLDAPRDWCHEDLDVDLPPWLHPLARAAGLRWQGLTFARLVVGEGARPPLRVVAPPRDSRGRKERQLCGELPGGPPLRWVDRLDKTANEANGAFADLRRGDGVGLSPPGPRVTADTRVERFGDD